SILVLGSLALSQTFSDSSGDVVYDNSDRLGSIVVAGNGKVNLVGIAVGIHHTKSGDTQALGFCQSDMFVTDIHNEEGGGNTTQLGDTTQHFFHLLLIAGKGQPFFLGDAVE